NNRVEAQIEGEIKGIQVTFFDSLYGRHKTFYRFGMYYEFVLAGFAYSCSVIDPPPLELTDPKIIEILRKDEDDKNLSSIQIETKGMASIIQMEDGDRDDYQFHAPVRSVEEIEIMGQHIWNIRATILRSSENDNEVDIDIDIYVTKNALEGEVPKPGQDIAGTLWLQGYMVLPGLQIRIED
ncbi:MAG: hypothetical protein ACRENO_01065, partial [Thermodesulfobacteriota bacterium]